MSTMYLLKKKYQSITNPEPPLTSQQAREKILESLQARRVEQSPLASVEPSNGHSLYRLTARLNNTPHLIDEGSFTSIIQYLDARNAGKLEIAASSAEKTEKSIILDAKSKTGVIQIEGPLTYKSTGFEALCGGASYQSIKEQFNQMVAAGARTIVLQIDSGGGEAYGMAELGQYLRSTATSRKVKLIAYVESLAASAAYGLACCADEVIANPGSTVGSIGVVVRLVNDSKHLEQKGYSRTFIYAGSQKVPYAANGEFSESFLADIQSKVDSLYADFTGYVAKMRNLPVFSIKNTEAKTYLAGDALKLKLVDRILTVDEFHSHLSRLSR